MAQQLVMKTETVQTWAMQPTDEGRNTAIVFRVQAGTAAFSFSPDDFARFTEAVVVQASKPAGGQDAAATPQSANPIQINSLSIEPHPDDHSSALLALDAGKVQLLFAADVKMLLDACKHFLGQWREHRGVH
jgi:hypothetical protein